MITPNVFPVNSAPTEWAVEVAKTPIGTPNLDGVDSRFARDPNVGPSYKLIWPTTAYTFPTTASTLEVVSSSANDGVAGSGARSITILGVTGAGEFTVETINTNGTSASNPTTNSFLRVVRAFVATSGAYTGTNAGDITIRRSGGGATQGYIVAGVGQTQQALAVSAANRPLLFTGFSFFVDSTKAVDVAFWQRENYDDATAPFSPKRAVLTFDQLTGYGQYDLPAPVRINPKSDFWAEARVGSGTGKINLTYSMVFFDE